MDLELLPLAFQGDMWNFSKDDCISTLPDDILYSIISLLTVRDTLKAHTLSRRWRYLCVTMPDLNFDLHTVFGVPTVWQVQDAETFKHHNRCPKYKCEFVKILNQFLKLYLGPKIGYFRISFCLQREHSGSIDEWVSLAVRMGVEKLELNFVCFSDYALKEDNYNNFYTVSLQLLSEASKLKHLRLSACILKPDLTGRFNSLTNLYLYCVPLAQVELLQMVLSNCSNLERLTVKRCTLPVKVCICDLFTLKFFELIFCKGLRNLELSATNLTTFEISDGEGIKISFSSVPKLEKVYFALIYHNSIPYIFGEVAEVLPQLKTLSILVCPKSVKNMLASSMPFSNVNQLELFMTDDRQHEDQQYDLVKIIAPLLTALPLLQKLYVAMPSPKYFERREEELPVHLHSQLKEVEIGGFHGTWNQIEFAICLLKNAVALEEMVIDVNYKVYFGDGVWFDSYKHFLWPEEKRKFICDQLLGKIFSRKTRVIIR